MRIPIVEDNKDCADTQAWLLRSWGFDVRIAADGETAFEIVHEYQPDVMLIDIGLPGMDGCALLRSRRVRTRFAKSKLLAISGRGDAEIRNQVEEAGFEELFVKPADPLMLRAAMWEVAHQG